MLDMLMRNKKMAALIIVGIVMLGLISSYKPLSTISNYQGIHPSFAGIYFDNYMFTASDSGNASTASIQIATFDFDPDKEDTGLPNLRGELRDIQIVRDLASYEVADTASHILSMGGQPEMPYKVYEWQILDSEGLNHAYRLENWLCSFEVNIWTDPDARPWYKIFAPFEKVEKYPATQIWLSLEVGPSWYFEGADEVYFGLGYMELAEMTYEEKDTGVENYNPLIEVMPESKWAAYSIYDGLGGANENVPPPASQSKMYEGTLLNPAVFKDNWYVPITIDNFGTSMYNNLDGSYVADSIQQKILVHVFVVGEWIVKPEEERDMDEHDASEVEGWLTSIAKSIGGFFSNPFALGGGALILVAFVLFWVFGIPKFLRRRRDG